MSLDLLLDVGADRIAVTVFAGDAAASGPQPVVFLFPGGGLNREYYDLPLAGGYSQARWLADRGLVVVTVDHPGTGQSPVPDGVAVDGRMVGVARTEAERVADAVVRHVIDGLRAGTLHPDLPVLADPVPIGTGHSLGGHVVVGAQAAYGTFAGVAPFGAAMSWTRLALQDGFTQPFRAASDLEHKAVVLGTDWPANDFWSDAAPEVVAADRADPSWRRTNIPGFGAELLEPFATARQAASVRVPVLLVYGERDVTNEPLEDVAVFRAAPSVALTVVPRMAHGHNFATTREVAWARLAAFVDEVMALRALGYPG